MKLFFLSWETGYRDV